MAEMTLSAKLAVSVYLFYYTPVVKHFLCHRRIVHKSDILFYFISDYIKRKRFSVGSCRCHCINRITHGDYSCADWNLIRLCTERVALSVISFVVTTKAAINLIYIL